MRLERIEIEWTRGIVHTSLDFCGDNFLISGPNGAGKSAVVDAIEVLVKGKMTRLEGEGTASISLKKHGPHIDAKTKNHEAIVRGTFRDKSTGKSAVLTRKLSDLETVTVEGEGADICRGLLSTTKEKQFILTRRQILEFIASPPRDRLAQVSHLLNLTEVEAVRVSLQKLRNEKAASAKAKASAASSDLAELNMDAGIDGGTFDPGAVLAKVNELRQQLGGGPILDITKGVTYGIAEPTAGTAQAKVNWTVVRESLAAIENAIGLERSGERRQLVSQLSDRLSLLGANPAVAKAIRAYRLIELGESLLEPGAEACPLCDKVWVYEQLSEYLANRRALADNSRKVLAGIRDEIEPVLVQGATLNRSLEYVRAATHALLDSRDVGLLDSVITTLGMMRRDLEDAFTDLSISEELRSRLSDFDLSDEVRALLNRINSLLPKDESADVAKRSNWDILARIGKALESYEAASAASARASADLDLAEAVYERFLKARSSILGALYGSIKDRFVALYQMIHGSDEAGFEASMEPSDAGIELEVDFYGRGAHHPCAMHSEGHQDSMGLCLFLALVEGINSDCFPIVVLDDVMTSVDHSHRKELVAMLKSQFPSWQFIVTTHEDMWARKLRYYGLIAPQRHVQFYGWTVDGGPIHRELMDFREAAQKEIDEEKMGHAAWTLRNGLESFYREACDSIGGAVTYQAAGAYDLGSLMDPTLLRYDKLLGKGISMARAAGDEAKAEYLQNRKGLLDEARKARAEDGWILNPLVHFNEWASFSKDDLQNLLNAHVALCRCLSCDYCGGLLQARREGAKEIVVQCDCGKTSWFVGNP